MVTLITLIVAFVVLVGNLIAAKLIFDKTKNKKYSILAIVNGFMQALTIILMVFVGIDWMSLLLMTVILTVFVLDKESKKGSKDFLFTYIIVTIFIWTLALILISYNNHYHEINLEYHVTIKDDTMTVEFTEVPKELRSSILREIISIPTDTNTEYTSKIKAKYICSLKNHESECACTDSEICENCKSYVKFHKFISVE